MIIDSHCHAWPYWPYQPPVPDPRSRAKAEMLLHEMTLNGVDQAMLVCAQIEHNPANNAYVARVVQRHPDRLHQVVDLDSSWSKDYHSQRGAERLRRFARRWPLAGFTHYLDRADDGGWLSGPHGQAIFAAAEELGLLASLSCYPHQLPAIRALAARFPQVPVLLHHLGHPALGQQPLRESMDEILACARLPNIYIKLSGFVYAQKERAWDFPYPAVLELVRAEYEHFGPRRMCWGSDYPVVGQFMTYQQALEAFRAHCRFVPAADQAWILGETLAGLLNAAHHENCIPVNRQNDDRYEIITAKHAKNAKEEGF